MRYSDSREQARARYVVPWRRTLATFFALGVAFVAGQYVGSSDGTPDSQLTMTPTPAIREALALEDDLQDLEAKMHQGLFFTMHNEELARRHMQVSAIACASAEEHAKDALRLAQRTERQNERQTAARLKEKQEANNGTKARSPNTRSPRHRSG